MADFKSSNTDTIVKIILVFFISLLSFSIGTFVGKKFSDNQHKLSTMEPTKSEEKTTHQVENPSHGTQEESLNDDQIAALANEFVDEETQALSKNQRHEESPRETTSHPKVDAPAHAPTTANTPSTAAASAHESAPAAASAHESAPAPEPAHSQTKPQKSEKHLETEPEDKIAEHETPKAENLTRIPSSVAKEKATSTSAKFTIQIASYPSEDEAQKKADELKKLNFEAFFTPATIKGQTWYRVNVGSYVSAKEALEHKNELIEKTHIGSAIIQKISQ